MHAGHAVRLAEAGLAACQGMDMLLGGMGGLYLGLALSEKFDLPFLQAHLLPFTPSGVFPSILILIPGIPSWAGTGVSCLSHHLTRQLMWPGFRKADTMARQEVLDLPPAPFPGPYNSPYLQNLPVLYGFSPTFLPPPTDWDANTHVTGYWFLDSRSDWAPSFELTNFIDAGPPPVYIGFGSMSNRNPRSNGQTGYFGRQKSRSTSHSGDGKLLPQGLVRSHCPGRSLLLAGWPRRFREAVSDEALRERAAAMGAAIRSEDGVSRAAVILDNI
jgi:hypothetical protein